MAADLYRYTVAGLDALQLVLVGTTLEAATFLFESPTGMVADLYGRRLSVVIGTGLVGAGFILEGSIPSFLPILLAQVIWGVGYTFTTGALQAWLTDEIGEEAAGAAFLREAQFGQLGSLCGIALGAGLGSIQLQIPMILGGALFLFWTVCLLMIMPEDGFQRVPRHGKNLAGGMIQVFRAGITQVRQRVSLRWLVLLGFFFGLYSEGYDRLWQAFMRDSFNFPLFHPVVWFGVVTGLGMLFGAAANRLIEVHVDTSRLPLVARTLACVTAGMLISLFVFAGSGSLVMAVMANLIFRILRSTVQPLFTTWMNRGLDPSVRATVLSMSSQVDALGQMTSGPLVGWLARRTSLRVGMYSAVLLLSPALGVLGKMMKMFQAKGEGARTDN